MCAGAIGVAILLFAAGAVADVMQLPAREMASTVGSATWTECSGTNNGCPIACRPGQGPFHDEECKATPFPECRFVWYKPWKDCFDNHDYKCCQWYRYDEEGVVGCNGLYEQSDGFPGWGCVP
jgi:hypothetical protein